MGTALNLDFTKILNVLGQLSVLVYYGCLDLMSTFKNVVEKLKTLESERRSLLLEIEELKKMADSKAKALENEVSMLREEVKSLRVLLGADEPRLEPEPKRKQYQK